MKILLLEPDSRVSEVLKLALQKRGHTVESLARQSSLTSNGLMGYRWDGSVAAVHFGDSKRVAPSEFIQAAFVSPSLPFMTGRRIYDVDRNSPRNGTTAPIVKKLHDAGVVTVLVGVPPHLLHAFGEPGEKYDFHIEPACLDRLLSCRELPQEFAFEDLAGSHSCKSH